MSVSMPREWLRVWMEVRQSGLGAVDGGLLGSLEIKFKIFPVACRAVSWPPEGTSAQHSQGLAFALGQPYLGIALSLVCPPCSLVLWGSGNLKTSKAANGLRFRKAGCCSQIYLPFSCEKVCVE